VALLVASGFVAAACAPKVVTKPSEPLPTSQGQTQLVGVVHVVGPEETLWRISQAYGVSVEDIALVNDIRDPGGLAVGRQLVIPGASRKVKVPPPSLPKPVEPAAPPAPKAEPVVKASGARLDWPLVGVLYARFGKRGESQHDGIDIAAPLGTPILAAAEGVVLYSGYQRGYGHIVIVDHGGGLLTLYAHNQANLVKEGERVKAGTPVAKVGMASRTSGPHVHFEVREDAVPKDPLKFLPEPR